jgi:hypothetical protein
VRLGISRRSCSRSTVYRGAVSRAASALVSVASIAALALPIAGCGDDKSDAAKRTAEKYCNAVKETLPAAADALEDCVKQIENITSEDVEDIQRELKEATDELKTLPKGPSKAPDGR